MRAVMIAVWLLGLLSGAMSYAEDQPAAPATLNQIMSNVKTQCQSDIKSFCKEITPGSGRISACLDSKSDKISSACKTARSQAQTDLSNRMDKAEVSLRKDCGSDIHKFCSTVPSGGGRVMDCLDGHKSELSGSCKGFQAKLNQKLSEFLG